MAVSTDNPFFNRGCIDDARFFVGRDRELREVFNLLNKPTPQSVSIVGQRKIGKSSLLQHLTRPQVMQRHGADPDDLLMVYVNFEGLAYFSELECLQKLMWDTHEALAGRGIRPGEELKIDLSAATPFRIIEGLGRLFRFLRGQEKHLIYLFDEFEVSCANPHLTINFFNTLRSFATNNGVAYVTATKQELWQLPHYRMGKSSPFFNYFTTVYLGLCPEAEGRLLIRTMAEDVMPWEDHAIGQAGLFPFFLQLLCWFLWEKVTARTPDEALQQQARQGFLTQASPHFEFYWDQLGDTEKAAARDLSQDRPPAAADASSLEGLERKALAFRRDGEVCLFSEAFKAFVRSRD